MTTYKEAGVVKTKGEEEGIMKGFFDHIKNTNVGDALKEERCKHPTDESYIVWLHGEIKRLEHLIKEVMPVIEFAKTVEFEEAHLKYLDRIFYGDGIPLLNSCINAR